MPGLILLLDADHERRVESLWEAMDRQLGIPRGFPGALPHVTLHLAEQYEEHYLRTVAESVSGAFAPFVLRTTGPAVFSGQTPVVHLSVVRSPALASLHGALWRGLEGYASGTNVYYGPDRWMPHITLGHSNLTPEAAARLLPWLLRKELAWEFEVSVLAYGEDTADGVTLHWQLPLGASDSQAPTGEGDPLG